MSAVFNNGLAGVVATLRQQQVGERVREGAVPVLVFDENSTGAPSAFGRRASMASMTGPAAPLPALNTNFSGGEIVSTDIAERVVVLRRRAG